ncbi:DUF2332 domain-containing protein [Sphingorhabdus arenilitoris]|uniref:DUF2332 domain-containing protein n=1 Tax=Sphingorhabdus arenilitoris TaxID=1490041 RepID=A0ABV8RGC5_9SPHN
MDIFDIDDVRTGLIEQAKHIRHNNAPATARICEAQLALLNGDSRTAERLRNWPGKLLADAVPLRLAGGLHYLHLTGAEDRLLPIYREEITDQQQIDAIVADIVADHDAALLPWFDGPPQTNEAGRSASFMAALKWLSSQGLPPHFEMNELGASAGINTMMDRYHYDLCGVTAGPTDSPMHIKPEWRGPAPPQAPVEIVSIQGCDQNPVDLSDADAALRVKSYVWPENKDRIARMDAAITLAAARAPDVVKADAADWTDMRLSDPQAAGISRVVHHSIVWQYIPKDRRDRISAAMAAAGARATADKPLAWIMLETNRATFRHELTVRVWDGGNQNGEVHLLGQAQAHGLWVEWF